MLLLVVKVPMISWWTVLGWDGRLGVVCCNLLTRLSNLTLICIRMGTSIALAGGWFSPVVTAESLSDPQSPEHYNTQMSSVRGLL